MPVLKNYKIIKNTDMNKDRADHEPPRAIQEWGWRYHHMGIPTNKKIPGEKYIPHLKFYTSGFGTSPFGIEWMRFEEDSPFDSLIKTVPHIAFEVDNLDQELERDDFKILNKVNSPSDGVKVAMINYDGAPVELIEFEKNM
jgi:hypothetical protein